MIGTFQRQHQALHRYFRLPALSDELDRLLPSPIELIRRRRIAFLPLILTRDDASLIHDMIHEVGGRGVSSDGLPTGSRRHDDELALIKLLWSAAKFSGQHHILALTCPEDSHSLEAFERLGVESCLFIGAQELLGRLDRLARLGESNRRHQPTEEAGTPARPPEGWRLDGPEVRLAPREWTEMPAEIDPSLRALIAQVFAKEFHDIELSRRLHEQAGQIARLSARLAELEGELAGIHRSNGWAILHRAIRLKRRLVPRGSRRERVWSLGMRFARVCATQGVRTALVKGAANGRRKIQALVARPVSDRRPRPHPGGRRAGRGGRRAAHGDGRRRRLRAQLALDDVRQCLESVVRPRSTPDALIVVDDGSGAETAAYLDAFSRAHGCRLVRNEAARGYTFAANQGLEASSADFVILLNSDTVVSPGWVNRLIACASPTRGSAWSARSRTPPRGSRSRTSASRTGSGPRTRWARGPRPRTWPARSRAIRAGSTPVSPSSTGSAC